jgi:hypothetical protein
MVSRLPVESKLKRPCDQGLFIRAGDRTRTGDPHLGKVILPILALQGHRTERVLFLLEHPFRLLTFIIRGYWWTLLGDGMGSEPRRSTCIIGACWDD